MSTTTSQPKETQNTIIHDAILAHSQLEGMLENALRECRLVDYSTCLDYIHKSIEKAVALRDLSAKAFKDRYP